MALVSEVNIGGRTLVTYNLHLESRGDDNLRCSQLNDCLEDARRYNSATPIILAGDFNLDVSRGTAADVIKRAQFRNTASKKPVRTTPGLTVRQGTRLSIGYSYGDLFELQACEFTTQFQPPTTTHSP